MRNDLWSATEWIYHQVQYSEYPKKDYIEPHKKRIAVQSSSQSHSSAKVLHDESLKRRKGTN